MVDFHDLIIFSTAASGEGGNTSMLGSVVGRLSSREHDYARIAYPISNDGN
ncbi:MAG: hypothetical protein PVF65_04650 [Sphingomonadales bacterium]